LQIRFDPSAWAAAIDQHKVALGWVAFLSVLLFFGCLLVVPYLVTWIPEDYFDRQRRPRTPFAGRHPALRWSALIGKNLAGAILILAGVAMLLLPGQGLLTLAVGVMLVDFPGKHRLERKIVGWPPVLRSVNWLRQRANVPPMRVER
jgi:hypothetical protein